MKEYLSCGTFGWISVENCIYGFEEEFCKKPQTYRGLVPPVTHMCFVSYYLWMNSQDVSRNIYLAMTSSYHHAVSTILTMFWTTPSCYTCEGRHLVATSPGYHSGLLPALPHPLPALSPSSLDQPHSPMIIKFNSYGTSHWKSYILTSLKSLRKFSSCPDTSLSPVNPDLSVSCRETSAHSL